MQEATGDKHFTYLPSTWIDKSPVLFRQFSLRAFGGAAHRQASSGRHQFSPPSTSGGRRIGAARMKLGPLLRENLAESPTRHCLEQDNLSCRSRWNVSFETVSRPSTP